MGKNVKKVAIAGHFNPLHIGHLELIREAKKLGDKLIVIVCNDYQARLKRPNIFLPLKERMEIISMVKGVDEVVSAIDTTANISKTLRMVKPDIFVNGCDITHPDVLEEIKVCKRLGIDARFNVGGFKIRSSSEILNNYSKSTVL